MPDTVRLVQWPVITTVLDMPLTLTMLSLQAIVRFTLTPETLRLAPAGGRVVAGCAVGVGNSPGDRRGGRENDEVALGKPLCAECGDATHQNQHADNDDRGQDPPRPVAGGRSRRWAAERAAIAIRRRWRAGWIGVAARLRAAEFGGACHVG